MDLHIMLPVIHIQFDVVPFLSVKHVRPMGGQLDEGSFSQLVGVQTRPI